MEGIFVIFFALPLVVNGTLPPPSGIWFVSSREILQIFGQDYVFWRQFGFLRYHYEAAQSLTYKLLS